MIYNFSELETILPISKKEVEHIRGRPQRIEKENRLKKTRLFLSQSYWRIRLGHDRPADGTNGSVYSPRSIVPTVQTFFSLPAVAAALRSGVADPAEYFEEHKVHIWNDLKLWISKTEMEFTEVLGRSNLLGIDDNRERLRPVHTLTAWFTCKICADHASSGKGNHNSLALDFEAACHHQCAVRSRKRKRSAKRDWNIKQFSQNEKVSTPYVYLNK